MIKMKIICKDHRNKEAIHESEEEVSNISLWIQRFVKDCLDNKESFATSSRQTYRKAGEINFRESISIKDSLSKTEYIFEGPDSKGLCDYANLLYDTYEKQK